MRLGSRFLFLLVPATLRLATLAQCKHIKEVASIYISEFGTIGSKCPERSRRTIILLSLRSLSVHPEFTEGQAHSTNKICGSFIFFFVKIKVCIQVYPIIYHRGSLIIETVRVVTTLDRINQ